MDCRQIRRPIAVFDSGLGGLTVVRQLRKTLPLEDIVYFGDTARVPYGSKSSTTVSRFAREITGFLLRFDPKLLVVACNTVSAVSLEEVENQAPVAVVGVVSPGAERAVQLARGRMIAVLATQATVASDAYRLAINRLEPSVPVIQKVCPLFVPMVEEGRDSDDRLVRMAIEEYLAPVRRLCPAVVVLGCTHYPMLSEAIAQFFGPEVEIVDSAMATAWGVRERLTETDLLSGAGTGGRLDCYVSDNPERFQHIANRFLSEPVAQTVRVSPEALVELAAAPVRVATRASA